MSARFDGCAAPLKNKKGWSGRPFLSAEAFPANEWVDGMKIRGCDIWSAVMNVIQITGSVATILLLKRFTPLPFWACFVIGFPMFIAVFLGLGWVLFGRRNRR